MIDPRLKQIFRIREARDVGDEPDVRARFDMELRAEAERLLSDLTLTDLTWRDFLHQTKESYLAWRRRRHE